MRLGCDAFRFGRIYSHAMSLRPSIPPSLPPDELKLLALLHSNAFVANNFFSLLGLTRRLLQLECVLSADT